MQMTDKTSSGSVHTEIIDDSAALGVGPEKTGSLSDSLPRDTVHCYPARRSLIIRRRILSGILGVGFIALLVFFLQPDSGSIGLAGFSTAGIIICLLVFIQTVLIAVYR